jgi:hypothetical protein
MSKFWKALAAVAEVWLIYEFLKPSPPRPASSTAISFDPEKHYRNQIELRVLDAKYQRGELSDEEYRDEMLRAWLSHG